MEQMETFDLCLFVLQSFVAIVQLVKRMEISMLVESIKSNKFITKEQVLSDSKFGRTLLDSSGKSHTTPFRKKAQ